MDLESLENIPSANIIFLMACSNRKRELPGLSTLRDLYDGPTWQTLRTHGSHIGNEQILVLSGRYGWCASDHPSANYNQRISSEMVDALVETIEHSAIYNLAKRPEGSLPWQAVVVCGGEDYRRAFDAAIPALQGRGLVDLRAPILRTVGGIGYQRGQLGEILRFVRHHEPEETPIPSI